jgi:hypothetical protein
MLVKCILGRHRVALDHGSAGDDHRRGLGESLQDDQTGKNRHNWELFHGLQTCQVVCLLFKSVSSSPVYAKMENGSVFLTNNLINY